MDEADFNALADAELERLEGLLDACELDFDYEVKPGGVFELEFDNGTKIIVNRHSAAREIWLAAKSGGFHFRPDGGRWLYAGWSRFLRRTVPLHDRAGRRAGQLAGLTGAGGR